MQVPTTPLAGLAHNGKYDMSTGLAPTGEVVAITNVFGTSYVSLHTGDPGNTGASEVSGGAYARQPFGTIGTSGGDPTTANNSAIITFPVATVSWGTVGWFGFWTAASGGTFLGGNTVSTPKLVDVGDFARFVVNALTVTCQ